MVVKYQALLDRMAASDLPETAQYRVDLEKIARYRIKVAMENPDDPDAVEDLCQCGQVEELVEQADDEMEVLEMYLKERLWEYVDADVEIEYNPDPSADHEGIDDDEWGHKHPRMSGGSNLLDYRKVPLNQIILQRFISTVDVMKSILDENKITVL